MLHLNLELHLVLLIRICCSTSISVKRNLAVVMECQPFQYLRYFTDALPKPREGQPLQPVTLQGYTHTFVEII